MQNVPLNCIPFHKQWYVRWILSQILVSSIASYLDTVEHVQSLAPSKSQKYPRKVYYSKVCGLTLVDTHHSADGLVLDYKPDVTIYVTPPSGARPPVLAGNLAFFIEIQLADFDGEHATDIIKRSEIVLENDSKRLHVFTVWLTRTELSIHCASRNGCAFNHSFSSPQSLLEYKGDQRLAGVGLQLFASFFVSTDVWGSRPTSFPEDLSTYLDEERWSGSFEVSWEWIVVTCVRNYKRKFGPLFETLSREFRFINCNRTSLSSRFMWY